ncbi:MAG TPA: MoaD family protein [Thermodesulfobacteriota bacterium]|nr:MoaD family protein [Deltaproteobacteria bacterium]HNR13364.1 MoaD family protein [Thermodesulfobacteriota bacterium]HQO78190.1 MoaD family protein [Thermodesulfobacteriota bacterium]
MPRVMIRGVSFFQEIMESREIEMEVRGGSTVESLLAELDSTFGGRLSKRLYNEDGSINNKVRVFLNGRDICFLGGKSVPLSEGDIILLLPILAGG